MELQNISEEYLRKNREKWVYRGKHRPEFALQPGPGQESVWDYPRPPAIRPDNRLVVVRHRDILLAESAACVRVCETAGPPVFYIPPADVHFSLLQKLPATSICEWKGAAEYWDFADEEQRLGSFGWSYPDPFPEFASIKDYISFYPGRVTCTVGGELVRPQPGNLYGGWITNEIVGPFKGEAGTSHW